MVDSCHRVPIRFAVRPGRCILLVSKELQVSQIVGLELRPPCQTSTPFKFDSRN